MARNHARRFPPQWMLAAVALGCPAAMGRADLAGPPSYGVRSIVADPTANPATGRIYAILSVQSYSSDPHSLTPVDEDALMLQVCDALNTRGFRPVTKGVNPEIFVTVHYGRAWLRNPYLSEVGGNPATDGISSVTGYERLLNQDFVGASNRLMDTVSHGFEAKVRKAAAEKLYLRLTGWKYPPDPKAKARMLWQTTVLVDDPDRWNLNAVAGGMLTAAAPYFGQAVSEKELEVRPPLLTEHVNVGTLQVVEPVAPHPSPGTPAAAAAAHSPVIVGKKFDLPAGDAIQSLQLFSQQSGEEIIYPVEQLHGLRTNAVHGEMSARAALDRLLDGTGLTAVQDEKSDALAVRLSPRR